VDDHVQACRVASRAADLRDHAAMVELMSEPSLGNVANAHRAYAMHRSMLAREPGVEPAVLMEQLLAGLARIPHPRQS
jgi:hypothetical protein